MAKGIGLISGGLDSMLAVCILQEQGIDVHGISFETPFFNASRGRKVAKNFGIPFTALDITQTHMPIVKSPKYGYGKNMNPCIDCHSLMFRTAGKVMEDIGADFIFSGEVLGQRPKSQTSQAMRLVARASGYQEHIIRPLSAKLLPITKLEEEGIVDRSRLLDLQGRSRRPQIELAKKYGLTDWESPAGGCLLTYAGFSKKLREQLDHDPDTPERDLRLLKVGRHFRLPSGEKLVMGKNMDNNETIESSLTDNDIVLSPVTLAGPTAIIPNAKSDEDITLASRILLRYCKNVEESEVLICWPTQNISRTITVAPLSPENSVQYLIVL